MSTGFNAIVEKYCPVVGRNVAVEVSARSENACCLNAPACREEHGGCTNTLFTGSNKSE
jgi:hypothetical protein